MPTPLFLWAKCGQKPILERFGMAVNVEIKPFHEVREMGLEPTRQRHRNLNPARLPIPPLARDMQNPRRAHTSRAMEPLDRIELSTCSLRVSRSTD